MQAYGAEDDRMLGVPGEVSGSLATRFPDTFRWQENKKKGWVGWGVQSYYYHRWRL